MYDSRMTAEMDEAFVVFLIGMRINAYWKLHRWLPVFLAMPRMLRELDAEPDSGLLNYETVYNRRTIMTVQYWDSFEDLQAYARDVEREHVPAWVSYNESADDGAVGIFHETYVVDPEESESVYRNLPAFGLGAAGDLRPADGDRETAGKRLGIVETDSLPVTDDGEVTASDGR